MKNIMLNTKNRKKDFVNPFKIFFDVIINVYMIHNLYCTYYALHKIVNTVNSHDYGSSNLIEICEFILDFISLGGQN